MAERGRKVRDVARLAVARVGKVVETGDRLMPFRLLDSEGLELTFRTSRTRYGPPIWRRSGCVVGAGGDAKQLEDLLL